MLDWLIQNWGTLLAGIIVFGIAAVILIRLIIKKKKGKCGSCCCRGGCPMSGNDRKSVSGEAKENRPAVTPSEAEGPRDDSAAA